MIRLKVDDSVLEALKVAVPKRDIAKYHLDNYVRNLEKELNLSVARGRSVEAWRFDCYDISLTNVQENGGQIWHLKNWRLHRWLRENKLNLIEEKPQIRVANNLTKTIGLIKFTELVELIDQDSLKVLRAMTQSEFAQYLNQPTIEDINFYQEQINEANQLPKSLQVQDYDFAIIDIDSLKNYIHKLVKSELELNPRQEETNTKHAISILRIAQLNNGVLPQKKKFSEFGRTYYEGHSVQSVHKSLRKAMLGDSYEYDINSSVISWKMAFAQEYLDTLKTKKHIYEEFYGILYYLDYKFNFYEDVLSQTFTEESTWSLDKKKKKLKQAMTAFSFGAKLIEAKWKDVNGYDKVSSVMEILNYADERERFMRCGAVTRFKFEQNKLDTYIANTFKDRYPFLDDIEKLKTVSGYNSKSKLISWLYQHAETIMMDLVRKELKTLGKTVLANVHDAIVVRERLTESERLMIQNIVRAKTKVDYFSLGETRYKRTNHLDKC